MNVENYEWSFKVIIVKDKKFWISAANVTACLSVIYLHCNGVFWSFPKGITWYTSNFIETVCYWAVPVFFMISGATLLNYRERYSTKEFLQKRFTRTGIPFLFWSLVAIMFSLIVRNWPAETLRGYISGIITTRYITIYWFFISLFAVYLSIPLLSAVNKELRLKVFYYIIASAFIVQCVLPTIFALAAMPFNPELTVAAAGGYIIYILIGYAIANTDLTKRQRIIIYICSLIGWLIHFQGTTILSFSAGELVGTFKGYLNFPAVMHATGVFTAFKYLKWDKIADRPVGKMISMVSNYTFGIYLMHFYLVLLIPEIMHFDMKSIVWRLFGPIVIFIVCGLCSYIVSRIPYIKALIGA